MSNNPRALKIHHFRSRFGDMTSAEALAAAEHEEATFRSMAPGDPASLFFAQGSRALLDYAALLEAEELQAA